MNVLIIEGDLFTQSIYKSELNQENVGVELAGNGLEGLEKAKNSHPDLIITELILTKLNGFEMIKELKETEVIKDVPIIVASALSQKQDIDEAMSLGIVKYLPKSDYSSKQIIKESIDVLMTKL